MIDVGQYQAVIQSNTLAQIAGKEAVRLTCTVGNDEIDVLIWLTEAAAGIARACLKTCGFKVDEQPLSDLIDRPDLLKGKEIPILVEEWNGRLRAQIVLNATPTKKRVLEIEKTLRDVKKSDASSPKDEPLPF